MSSTAQPVRCFRCRRVLRSAASLAAGAGPACQARIRAAEAAVAADFSAAQVRAALALIAAGSVTATARPGTYLVAGSDGVTVYLTTWDSCGCKGARFSRCKHQCAVRFLETVKASARKAA
jgi:hypothetical protein